MQDTAMREVKTELRFNICKYLHMKKSKYDFKVKNKKSNIRKSNVYNWLTEERQLKILGFEKSLRFD